VVEFQVEPADGEDPRRLRAAMADEMRVLYDGLELDAASMPKAGADELGPPGGAFVVGRDEAGTAVAGGGLKRFGDGVAEIKRMYVVPEARRRGVAQGLLAALEAEARRLGYVTVRLDTGDRQPGAQRLYELAGYRPIANYNGNPAAAWFGEKAV
jgi:GNAT superfamily N-acetyltransferase